MMKYIQKMDIKVNIGTPNWNFLFCVLCLYTFIPSIDPMPPPISEKASSVVSLMRQRPCSDLFLSERYIINPMILIMIKYANKYVIYIKPPLTFLILQTGFIFILSQRVRYKYISDIRMTLSFLSNN